MTKWFYKFAVVAGFGLLACAGGVGKGCAPEVLPNGFPLDQTVSNAADLRLTRSGLSFMEAIAPRLLAKQLNAKADGTLDFPIQTSTSAPFSVLGTDFTPTICPDGPTADKCNAVMDIANSQTQLDAQSPHQISVRPTVPLLLKDTPVKLEYNLLGAHTIYVHVAYGDNTSCSREVPSATPHPLPVRVRVPFLEGTEAPRTGYAYADVDNATIDTSGLSASNVKICADCGGLASWACNGILNSGLVKGNIINSLKGQIETVGKNAMKSVLCTQPQVSSGGAPSCPTGSQPNADGTQCVYSSATDKCVPRQLGLDGRANLGTLLASVSPGTSGMMDYLFAAGGTMDPWPMAPTPSDDERTPNGMTFHMMGGAIASANSRCVDPVALARPTGIPVPDEMKSNEISGWTLAEGPHAGFAVSERFLNYALGNAYNSGLLCLKLSTDTVPQLTSGTLALLAGSLKTLPTQGQTSAIALVTHPSSPPTVAMGSGSELNADPLLRVALKRFGIDVMVWSHDRYLRAFTYTADISIPVNLDVDTSRPTETVLKPKIGSITMSNPVVTNSEQLIENPEKIAEGLTSVVGSLVSGVAESAAQGLPLNGILASYGVGFAMPQGAVRKLSKDGDNFLGLFVNFTDTSAQAPATARSTRVWSLPSFGCSALSATAPTQALPLAVLAALGALLVWRRRTSSKALKWTAVCVAASLPACDCGNNADVPPKCGDDCSQTCEGFTERGLVGAYGSAATGSDGKVYIAGYADALFPSSGSGIRPYGDLAAGTLDPTTGITEWAVVDGLPVRAEGSCAPMDARGWRKGETDPGDNVGLWTSTALSSNGAQHIAYYDATHGALKYALREPGAAWVVHTITPADGTESGRYASLALRNGKPVIAYHRSQKCTAGSAVSSVMLAEATTAFPRAATDWTRTTVAEATNAECVVPATPAVPESIPARFGIYTRVFVSGETTVVAAFDSLSGKLYAYKPSGSSWAPTQVDGPGVPGGAATAGAGLAGAFDAAGTLHLSYVDAAHSILRHAALGAPPESVDDGTSPTGTPFSDRLHLLSPDTAIRIDASGDIHIAYQDGTDGALRFAVRTGTSWRRTVAAEKGYITGSFPSYLSDGKLLSFKRKLNREANEISGDLYVQASP